MPSSSVFVTTNSRSIVTAAATVRRASLNWGSLDAIVKVEVATPPARLSGRRRSISRDALTLFGSSGAVQVTMVFAVLHRRLTNVLVTDVEVALDPGGSCAVITRS